jgi:hypothetical protein
MHVYSRSWLKPSRALAFTLRSSLQHIHGAKLSLLDMFVQIRMGYVLDMLVAVVELVAPRLVLVLL